MYEILAGMNAYITDYSSAMFEAGFAGIPVFIYADDIEKYAYDRGSLMWNIVTDPLDCVTNNKVMTPEIDAVLPFPIACDNAGLEKNILNFDENIYHEKVRRLMKSTELIFDGKASQKVADKLESFMQM